MNGFEETVRNLYPFVFQSIETDGSYFDYLKMVDELGLGEPIPVEEFVDIIARTLAKQNSLKEAAEFYYEQEKKTGAEDEYPWMSTVIQENDDITIEMIIEFPPGEGAYLYAHCSPKTKRGRKLLKYEEASE